MVKNRATLAETPGAALGDRLRQRRKALGRTMQEVADAAGLSVGFISQVERDLTAPSLASLVSIAETLDSPLSDFLQEPSHKSETTRQSGRLAYSVHSPTVSADDPSYERLSTTFAGSRLHSVIVHEPPGRRAEPISHRGEEMFYLIAGEITVEIEGDRQILCAGDSIHFDSRRVHATWNHGQSTASILWCGTMNVFGDAPSPIHKEPAAQRAIPIQQTEDP